MILSEPTETAALPVEDADGAPCGRPARSVVSVCGHGGNGVRAVASGLFASKEAKWRRSRASRRATSSTEDRKEVLKRIKDEGVEFLLLWFTDLEGHLKSLAVTPAEMEEALDDGMGFDGSSITGFNAIEESDMVAIPTRARSS